MPRERAGRPGAREVLLLSGIAGCLLAAGCAGMGRSSERSAYPLPPSKQACASCHVDPSPNRTGALKRPPSELCIACHPDRKAPAEHAVDIVPPMAVQGLPLSANRMTCVTCHDPHANPYGSLLRKPEPSLCLSCHPY